MALAQGPKTLTCSARACDRKAAWAVIWSNPQLHYGRTKTWLACGDHRDYLTQYLGYRNFPTEILPLEEFLAREAGADGEPTRG